MGVVKTAPIGKGSKRIRGGLALCPTPEPIISLVQVRSVQSQLIMCSVTML